MGNNIHRIGPTKRFPKGGYRVRFRDANNRTRSKTFARKIDAERFKASVTTDKARGDFINPSDGVVPFEQVAEAWRASIQRSRKPRTVLDYESSLRAHVMPAFRGRRVGMIDHADVGRWLRALETRGLGAGTIRNAHKVLKQVLDQAVSEGRIKSNPSLKQRLPRLGRSEMLFLTASQVGDLCEVLRRPYDAWVRLAAYSGLRAGELAALRVGDVDWEQQTVRVRRTVTDLNGQLLEQDPKTPAACRSVAVPAFVMADLQDAVGDRRANPAGYVFVGPRGLGPIHHRNFYRRQFRPAVQKALPQSLQGLRFHDLRHTYASLLVEQGAHPKEMAELMGHSTIQITLDRYAHLLPHRSNVLAERLESAHSGRDHPMDPIR